jgi:hypothetical protein
MVRSLRKYSTSPVVAWLGRVVVTTCSLFLALLMVLMASSMLGGISVMGHHIPQPIVLMTVCS